MTVDVTFVTSAHDVADARLHREVAALRRAGLTVEVLGLGEAAAGPADATVVTSPRPGPLGRAVRAVALPWRAHGRVVIALDPDLVPSLRLLALKRRRVVVDVHEDYAALLSDRSWAHGPAGVAARALVSVSTRLAADADLTVVADDHVPPRIAAQRMVLRNLPDFAMLPAAATSAERDEPPRALYVGDLRASRGLFAMLDAVAEAAPWELDLVGPVAAADQPRLDAWLASSPAAVRVRLHGRLTPRAAWGLAAGASVGLLLLDATPAFVAAVPSKLYEYLACGLAVVATPLPRTAELLSEVGAGALASTVAEAATVLRAWSADPAALRALQSAAGAWSDDHLSGDPYADFAARVADLVR